MSWIKDLLGMGRKVQPVSVTDENFEAEVLGADLPVMMDVWSATCGPCKQLAPIVVDLATDYEGRVKVAEMNAATAPGVASRLGIRGTPTVIYFVKGREVERVVGFRGSLYHREIIDHEILAAGSGHEPDGGPSGQDLEG